MKIVGFYHSVFGGFKIVIETADCNYVFAKLQITKDAITMDYKVNVENIVNNQGFMTK